MKRSSGGEDMFIRLLVPLDGSVLSESSLPAASFLARALNASVILIHLIEQDAPKEIHSDRHLTDAGEADAYLEDVARRAFPDGFQVECHVHTAAVKDVARSLIDHASELNTDLIVMCTHGRSGPRDWFFGSIAQQVISLGKTPVLLIPPLCCQEMFEIRQMMVPLDGESDHEQGLPIAMEMAKIFQSKVYLLMVIPTIDALESKRAAVGQMLPGATRALLDMQEENGKLYLEQRLKVIRSPGQDVEAEVARGDPVTIIVDAAKRLSVDLIVLGTHGKTGTDAFWSRSATPKISSKSLIPLLLVPVRE
jgi:nucleotide-binding universal stress UspA family protein